MRRRLPRRPVSDVTDNVTYGRPAACRVDHYRGQTNNNIQPRTVNGPPEKDTGRFSRAFYQNRTCNGAFQLLLKSEFESVSKLWTGSSSPGKKYNSDAPHRILTNWFKPDVFPHSKYIYPLNFTCSMSHFHLFLFKQKFPCTSNTCFCTLMEFECFSELQTWSWQMKSIPNQGNPRWRLHLSLICQSELFTGVFADLVSLCSFVSIPMTHTHDSFVCCHRACVL